jgi:hypothetical protein
MPHHLQFFQIRYIWNLIANPMDLTLLRVNVKVIDSRSGVIDTMNVNKHEAELA